MTLGDAFDAAVAGDVVLVVVAAQLADELRAGVDAAHLELVPDEVDGRVAQLVVTAAERPAPAG